MIVDPRDAANVQVGAALFTALVVLLGAAVSWGSQRKTTETLQEREKANNRAHEELWGTIRDHEGRIGNLEGQIGQIGHAKARHA